MDQLDGVLAMELLTLASEQIQPYVLSWVLDQGSAEAAECTVLVIMRRAGGILLAIPTGFLPAELIEQGNAGAPDTIFGPSMEFEVPAMLGDSGVVAPTGEVLQVRVIDCSEDIVNFMRDFREEEEVVYAYDEDSPFAFPSIDALVPLVRAWALSTSERMASFYSPEEFEEVGTTDPPPLPKRPAAKRATSSAGVPKPKRATTSTLSYQMEEVMGLLPQMSQQLTILAERQKRLEDHLPTMGKTTAVALAQPLGSALELPRPSLASVAKAVPPPPKTNTRATLGLLASPEIMKPPELAALEEEKAALPASSNQIPGDALAQAVLAQSQALTSLVAQIAGVHGDPMTELATTTSAGARGASGRAKLQAELAQHKGIFFRSVMQSMARRMAPTSSTDLSAQELLDRGISGVRYLERFGGYSRQRELGQLQFQVMTAFDYLMAGQVEAAMDTVALLAVTIEQSNLDGGRMDLATLLCLQEDPPASIFVTRQMSSTSRTRAFAPLADQRWVTCALAFLKEMEIISSKRLELVGGGPKNVSETSSEYPQPKAKAKVKPQPKRKGGGKGSQQPQTTQEDAE